MEKTKTQDIGNGYSARAVKDCDCSGWYAELLDAAGVVVCSTDTFSTQDRAIDAARGAKAMMRFQSR